MLSIRDLDVAIAGRPVLSDVNLDVARGEVVGLVGESGSGKSMTALAAMRLLPEGAVASGDVRFGAMDVLAAPEEALEDMRGDDLGMVFQEPMTALNPVRTIGDQVAEGIRLHTGAGTSEAWDRAARMLERVGLPPLRFPLDRYPHQLSGGQRQRVVIAIACACEPDVLIADEPTTALDVTLQAQVLDLLRGLVDERGMGLLLISHDLAVVAERTDRTVVMRNGTVQDEGPTGPLLRERRHVYTALLARASAHSPARTAPPILADDAPAEEVPLAVVDRVSVVYRGRRVWPWRKRAAFTAVDDVTLAIRPGQAVGLVGESGCGKSTLARTILALQQPDAGTVRIAGTDVVGATAETLREARRRMQPVFQDPYGSFDPRHTVARIVTEPLYLEPDVAPTEARRRAKDALADVDLPAEALDRYPHEFSGGQRQRIAIARALITRPALIVADEPVSALDVSIRAQVLDLLVALRERHGIGYLFISHDLGTVRALCDEVLVMDAGRIVERGAVQDVLGAPRSDAARRLVAATPDLERALALRKDAP